MNNIKKVARLVKWLAIIFIVIASVSAFIYLGDNNVGASLSNSKTKNTNKKNSNVPYVASKTTKEIYDDLSTTENTDLDKKVEEMIKFISEEGQSDVIPKYLGKDEETQKEYLKTFIKANYTTMFPKLETSGEVDGIIEIKRNGSLLKYKKYDEFVSLVNSNDEKAEEYFTLQFDDTSAKLVVASWNIDSAGEKIYFLNSPWNYQTSLNLFAMPFDFIWAVLVSGRSKEFAYDLANLAISEDNYITITVYDTEITNLNEDSNGNIIETKENIVNMAVTRANTWLLEYEVECTVVINENEEAESETIGQTVDNVTLEIGTPTITEKLDKDSETENFVTLFNKDQYSNMRKNIISGSEWLFEMLQASESTYEMADIVKYILYKATQNEKFEGADINWQEFLSSMEMTNTSTSFGDSGFWWPIGSLQTETINGKLFASGTPALGASNISRAGRENSRYKGLNGATHEKDDGAAVDVGAGGKSDYYYVISIGAGTVLNVQNGNIEDGVKEPSVGNCVTVDYDGIVVRYMHLYKGSIQVSQGDKVSYGQVIGKIGNSGDSSGPHLHIDMKINGQFVDATEYINPDEPRVDLLYSFIIKFEGGQQYRQGEDYVIFNNTVDNCLEVTCGLVISFDKESGSVRSEFEKILGAGTTYKIGDIITKAQYEACFNIMKQSLDDLINKNLKNGSTLTKAQHDAIFTIGWRLSSSYKRFG